MTKNIDVGKLAENLTSLFATKELYAAQKKALETKADALYAQNTAVAAVLKSVVDSLSPTFRAAYAVELSDPVTAIPFLKGVIDDYETLCADADRQRQRYQEAFGTARGKYQDARARIKDFKISVGLLQDECENLESQKSALEHLVDFLNTANDDLTAQNADLREETATLAERLEDADHKIARRDELLARRGIYADPTPESELTDALKAAYGVYCLGQEAGFDQCAREVAQACRGKGLGKDEVVSLVRIAAGYETGTPGRWSNRESVYSVAGAVKGIVRGLTPDVDLPQVFNRLRNARAGSYPLSLDVTASFVLEGVDGAVIVMT